MRYLLIAFGLIGILLTRQYGESWDELKFYKYADSAIEAYRSWPAQGTIHLTGNTYDNYGPVYVMAVSLGARLLGLVLPWVESDIRHLLYFFSFLAGIWAFYRLATRWMRRTPALGATVLFATQPLFWGHAFISPKDIPFLTFFLLTLVFGLRMVDSFKPFELGPLPGRSRQALILLTALWFGLLILLFGGTNLIHTWIESLVRGAAAGEMNLLARFASDIRTAAPEIYIQKYFVLFLRLRAIIFWLSTALLAWLYWRLLPSVYSFLWNIAPGALFLGLTTCIRVLGPLAGLLIALYAFRQKGARALLMLGIYAFLAFVAMYATWPYLWPDPIGHLVESAGVMAKYPWEGKVLFESVMYNSTDIPRSYLPVLLGIQLTEPVWVLFAAGLGLTALSVARKQENSRHLLVLSLVWFVLPVLGFIALRSPLYDNFRQVFFILPPVFLMAGVVFEKIKRPMLQIALIVLCVLPGVIAGIRLHPYEYIYYNSFIGGEAGAFRRFELDYWGTSYREAAGWLNRNAPANAPVWVEGPSHLLGLYLRPDAKLYSSYEADRADHYDYVVALTRYDLDLTSYPQARVVHTITRDGGLLAVIKQP